MQTALAKEQQVPIFLNFMSQLKYDSIFIPERIELFIGLKKSGIPMEELQAKHYYKIKKVFEVSKKSMFSPNQSEKRNTKKISFKIKQTVIDSEKLKGFDQLVIMTEILVYKNEKIDINRSGLTLPIFIKDIDDHHKGSITIDTQYKITLEPKLEYKITLAKPL